LEYWTAKLDRVMKGENIDEKIPLEAYDAMCEITLVGFVQTREESWGCSGAWGGERYWVVR